MKVSIVQSDAILDADLRLDSRPYVTGGLEFLKVLSQHSISWCPLVDLTVGGASGIFTAPRFKRRYVSSSEYGIPFLGSSDIRLSDVSHLSYLAQDQTPELPELRIREGWILISCSGTIGRIAFARREIDGFAASQHIMRVIADERSVPPGYLFAYLAGRFGQTLLSSSVYGAVVQHIEPRHVFHLPVPRLNSKLEEQAHQLIRTAAEERTRASELTKQSIRRVVEFLGGEELQDTANVLARVAVIPSAELQRRLNASYYLRGANPAAPGWGGVESVQLQDVAQTFIPNIFRRIRVTSARHGYPYLTGADLYNVCPDNDGVFIAKSTPNIDQLLLRKGMLVIQDSGQVGGLIGRPVMIGSAFDGYACTNNMVRVVPCDDEDQAYLYAYLGSNLGYRAVVREAVGSSIPHLDAAGLKQMQIPWPDRETRCLLGASALAARRLRDSACAREQNAVRLIEDSLATQLGLDLASREGVVPN